jgi:hypothetical protein
MDELDDAAQDVLGGMFLVSAESCGKEVKEGTEALPAGAEDVFADLPDECNVGAKAFMDPGLHAFHVGLVLFQDVLKGSYHAVESIIGKRPGIVKVFLAVMDAERR